MQLAFQVSVTKPLLDHAHRKLLQLQPGRAYPTVTSQPSPTGAAELLLTNYVPLQLPAPLQLQALTSSQPFITLPLCHQFVLAICTLTASSLTADLQPISLKYSFHPF